MLNPINEMATRSNEYAIDLKIALSDKNHAHHL